MNVGESAVVWKSSNTSISNDATVNPDPHLIHTGLPAGAYWFELKQRIDAATGVGYRWLLSPTNGAVVSSDSCALSGFQGTMNADAISPTVGNSNSGSLAPYAIQEIRGNFTLSTGGDIGLEWAQHTANANDTVVKENSSFLIVRTA